jgi:glycosyltransferase involved in cell wall biosynthesis
VNPSGGRVTVFGLNYSPEPTGIAPYTAGLAEGLANRLRGVQVVTTHPHYPGWRRAEGYGGWATDETIKGVDVHRVRHFIPNGKNNLARIVSELTFGFRCVIAPLKKADRVILVSPALFSSVMTLARMRLLHRQVPVVVWVQDLYSAGIGETGAGGSLVARIIRRVESALLRGADGVVVIHDRFRRVLVEDLNVPAETVEVVRNWTHLPPTEDFDRKRSRQRRGWGVDETVVLHSGNMGSKQGLSNVVEAAALAQKLGERIRFVLMGDGGQRSALQEQAADVQTIEFIDPLPSEEFQTALSSADVLLVNELPGLREMAVPSKLTSYFNAGVAVLAATDRESITAEEIERSGGGLRVEPGNPLALLDGVRRLRDEAKLAAELGSKGQQFCRHVLSEKAALDHYDLWLSNLTTKHGR